MAQYNRIFHLVGFFGCLIVLTKQLQQNLSLERNNNSFDISLSSIRDSETLSGTKRLNRLLSNRISRYLSSTNAIINQKDSRLPIIYTFYERIDPNEHVKYTGMTDNADRHLLQLWKEYWTLAGWEPRILTLEDAQRHPDFQKVDKALDLEALALGYKDKMCYMRWLAMAAVGGGFLSDYDIFPIRQVTYDGIHLPNDGKMTFYDQAFNGAIPCLVSGSFNEFDRMSKLMIESTLKNLHSSWNELEAIFDVYKQDRDAFVAMNGVLRAERALTHNYLFKDEKYCRNLASSSWAIHFSHNSILQAKDYGYLDKKVAFNQRPTIAEKFLNEWNSKCAFIVEEPIDLEAL